MKVLVSGGAGFIGSNLAVALNAKGHDVTVLDDFSTGKLENIGSAEIKVIRGSIGDSKIVRSALEDVDAVIHLAAAVGVKYTEENAWRVFEVNNYFDHMFFDLVRKSAVKKLVFASSSEVYGNATQMPLKEGMALMASTPYQVCKLMGETYAKELYEIHGIDCGSIRYFNVYGPRQRGSAYGFVTQIFLENAIRGNALRIFGDGKQTRDFTYISDAVDANLLMLKKPLKGEVFNIGTGIETEIKQLARKTVRIAKSESEIVHVKEIKHEIRRRVADISKATNMLGFSPKVNIEEGLLKTLGWENGTHSRTD